MSSSEQPLSPAEGGRPRRRYGVWIVLTFVIAAAALVYRLRLSSQAASGKDAVSSAIAVGVSTAQKKDVPFYLTGLGTVTAFNTVTVHTRVDGEIMQVLFQEGQFVHKGDVLVEIDPRPYQVALEQAEGQLAKDVAAQQDARVDLGRYQQLWQAGVIPRQQLDSQQATVGQYDGAIKSDQAAIDNQKLELNYSRITSPIDGRVGLRLVDRGNIVHAADTNGMIVITQVQPIAVIFTIPEDALPQVVAQMRGRELSVEAYSRDNDTKLAEGHLLTIDNQIDPTTGTVKLKAQFENRDLSLWPNQFVNARLLLSSRHNAIVIPSAAIQNGAQGPFVYVVGADNRVQVRPLEIDFAEGNISVIRRGLSPAEQIVVDGADKLQADAVVNPHAANPGNGASSSSPPELHP
jgi:membrane fusion protein, multidrug efflux system